VAGQLKRIEGQLQRLEGENTMLQSERRRLGEQKLREFLTARPVFVPEDGAIGPRYSEPP